MLEPGGPSFIQLGNSFERILARLMLLRDRLRMGRGSSALTLLKRLTAVCPLLPLEPLGGRSWEISSTSRISPIQFSLPCS